ncbi:LPS assembly protein LptD [Candidatus Thioglobus sp.]|nr:LPS assembly protein LptD [Candidatus Thioglobus sp.]
MKKSLIFLVLTLNHFSVYAEGFKLSCIPNEPACVNCPEYQTLFPLEEFTTNTDSLDIEADQSEMLEGKYLLTGNVEVNSEKLYLAADDVEVSSIDNSLLATGNVRFQDETYLITSDLLSATRDENENLIATAANANYQDFGTGLGGANGYTESISKTSKSVLLKNSTYSLCPVNKNDWLIDAEQIELNLVKNRGVASNAIVKFYGVPIFYLPKYSWVLSGRGTGFLTPDYSSYTDEATIADATGKKEGSYSVRIPYYFNLAPDRDLLVALNYMSSRRFIYEGKYRQLIAPKLSSEHEDSIWSIEAKYLPEDKVSSLKRWLVNFSNEMDINDKTHLSAQYYRVSDSEYFKEIDRTNTNVKTLKSFLKLTYKDEENNLSTGILTEDEQVVNAGTPSYTRALEGSASKTLNADTKMPISLSLVSTKFAHATPTKESGLRTHGNLGTSRELNIDYPKITPKASVAITNYSLKNSPNINRTVFGSGLDIDFTINLPTSIFGYRANHRITPLISYNYRAKKVQGNIPIFDTEDKYSDIISFSDLTSGERYSGLDRITNANDITLSLESSYRDFDALDDDKDLLNMRIAQSFYTDDEVVSATSSSNYETRKSYSDIAASIDIALGKYVITNSAQFNPDTSKIVKKENSLSYTSNSRKFITVKLSKVGTSSGVVTETNKLFGAYPLTDSIHLFGGLDETTSTGVTNSETTGIAYESCCWAFRIAHFKEDKGLGDGGFNYSTGMELVLTGLGSTSTPLKGRIENRIPGYKAKLR